MRRYRIITTIVLALVMLASLVPVESLDAQRPAGPGHPVPAPVSDDEGGVEVPDTPAPNLPSTPSTPPAGGGAAAPGAPVPGSGPGPGTPGAEDETDPSKITVEEWYRENDITFFGRDIEACGAGGGGAAAGGAPANLTVDKNFSLGTDPRERRVNLARALMRDFGFTAAQAAGVVGNFQRESGGAEIPPNVNEGGRRGPPAFRGGYGWAQWTGPRQRSFVDWYIQNGFGAPGQDASDAANYGYLVHELTNTAEKRVVEALKRAATPEDAAFVWEDVFERAGVKANEERATFARNVFAELGGGGPAAPGAGPSAAGAGSASCGGGGAAGGAAIVGDTAFPLRINKGGIDGNGMFANGTTNKGGHPYTAYDILVPPGTPVLAFTSGTVTSISQDRCPGRLISIHNPQQNVTISYLHLNTDESTHVAKGVTVQTGQQIGVVGPANAGCGIPHLHIDGARGNRRPGCSRLNCPQSNASQFIDLGPQLFQTYQLLPP